VSVGQKCLPDIRLHLQAFEAMALVHAPLIFIALLLIYHANSWVISYSHSRVDLRMKMMEYTTLGDSDLKVSKICLGTMTWGQQNTIEDAKAQLDLAFDKYGLNFIDTAEMYPIPAKPTTQGDTDRYIAEWLKTRDRSKVIVASKVAGFGGDRLTWFPGRDGKGSRVSKKDIKVSIDESLKRLKTDYIDLIQIHWPDRYVPLFGAKAYNMSLERDDAIPFQEQLEAFAEVIKEGKVRYVGVSNETPYGVMKFTQLAEKLGLPKIVSIQNSYSMLVRSDYESSLVEVCSPRNENIGLLAYSPLCGGILTGKYSKSDLTDKNVRLNMFPGYMARYKQSLTLQAVEKYIAVAEKYKLTPTQLALAWCYKQPHVASTIIGATSLTQLSENIEAYGKISSITDEVLHDIEQVYKIYRDPTKDM
jgi:aryl-alcohol dehydrogenase-like predicted oxidoreductase